jgi:hypothetical protein
VGAACFALVVEEVPSPNSGTMAGSIYRGQWVRTFIFLPFEIAVVAEAAVFSSFLAFAVGSDNQGI